MSIRNGPYESQAPEFTLGSHQMGNLLRGQFKSNTKKAGSNSRVFERTSSSKKSQKSKNSKNIKLQVPSFDLSRNPILHKSSHYPKSSVRKPRNHKWFRSSYIILNHLELKLVLLTDSKYGIWFLQIRIWGRSRWCTKFHIEWGQQYQFHCHCRCICVGRRYAPCRPCWTSTWIRALRTGTRPLASTGWPGQ